MVWSKYDSQTLRTEIPYRPDFCLQSEGKSLAWAEAELARDRRVERTWRATTCPAPGTEPVEVLRVLPWNLHDTWSIASDLRRRAHTKGYLFFDVDHQPESRWMHAHRLFPLCRLADDGSLRPHEAESRFEYDFAAPPLTCAALEVRSHVQGVEAAFTDPLDHVTLDGNQFVSAGPDDEPRVLRQVGRLLRALDPDVITTWGGDAWDIPYLLTRINLHGLRNEVWLGRAPDPQPGAPDQDAKSVLTYGRILYRTNAYYLRGRFHVDMGKKSLVDLPDRSDLWGLLYMTRISNRRLQDVNRNGPGYCLQQIQIDLAQDEGAALPWKRNLSEDWKDVATLCAVDRGGQIMKPRPGLYGDVWALDFSAYYPSIVVARNLSSDTINCACCPDSTEIIPDLGYHVCQKRGQGHQVRVLAPTVEHRRLIKARLKRAGTSPEEVAKAQAIKGELKGLGVVCFGYFRYRNARYGCAEIHQAIQAYGRRGMNQAKLLAEEAGFEVLHQITDCLVLSKPGATHTEILRLASRIKRDVGAPVDVEGHYKWLMLLDSKTHSTEEDEVGVPNRYYGLFEDGELKLRGIELRRHSTPPFIQRVQKGMLAVLAQAQTPEEFHALLPAALAVAREAAGRLRQRAVPHEDLVLLSRTRQSVEEYRNETSTKVALRKLRDAGIELKPGQSVPYVITRGKGPPNQRSVPAQLWGRGPFAGATTYDVEAYLRQLARSIETLLPPLGYEEEAVLKWLNTIFSQSECGFPGL